jgi:transposase
LAEYGIAIPVGISHITKDVPKIMEDGDHDLPGSFKQLIGRLIEHFKELDKQVGELEAQIKQWHRENEASCRLAKIPGIGPISASALAASVGDGKSFKNGRQLAAWLGLVPRQHSTGGKSTLLGISKRGDSYLRTLLIHGARSVVRVATTKNELTGSWLQGLLGRRNANIATVALANKNARIVWALLFNERKFRPDHVPAGAGA